MEIKFTATHDMFQDCMTLYDITLNGSYTLNQFVEHVLTERKGEWGYIDTNMGRLEYSHGRLETKTAEEFLRKYGNMTVDVNGEAFGGYSRMGYLSIGEPKEESKRELSDFDKVAVITIEKLKKYILTHQKWAADLCINAIDADELWEWLSHNSE